MGIFTASMVMVVVVVTLDIGNANPLDRRAHWEQWRELQRQKQESELPAEPQTRPETLSILQRAQMEQAQRERQKVLQKQQMELMQQFIEDYELDELAVQIGSDLLGRILSPMGERTNGVAMPMDQCVTRNMSAVFEDLQVSGNFVYTACGAGDGASLHLRFELPGATTPSMETTTPSATTPTPTPMRPCPIVPEGTPGDAEETTTPEAPETTTPESPNNVTAPATP